MVHDGRKRDDAMNMNKIILLSVFLFVCTIMVNNAAALTVTVSQPGADSDEVMKDRPFTVEATGWTGDCSQAQISFTGCSSCNLSGEDQVKTIGGGATTVTWTTVGASQKAAAQSITVNMLGVCGGQSDSSTFDIVLPPSLTVDATTNTSSLIAGSTFDVNLNIINNGETTANDITIDVSGTGISVSSGCSSISSIDESQSASQSCVLTASTAGEQTVTFTVSSTNADDATDSFVVTVTSSGGQQLPGGPGGSLDGGLPSAGVKATKKWASIEPGTSATMDINRSGIDFTKIRLMVKETASNVQLTLTTLADKPANTSAAPGNAYQYINVEAENINDSNIESAHFEFRVNNSWISDNNIDKNKVYLYRYTNQWNQLTTTLTSEDDNYTHYTATVPGFSYFVIAGEAITPSVCTPGEKRCLGDELQNCYADGSAWETIETCQYGCNSETLVCNTEPVGPQPVCTPGEKRCMGDDLQACSADGSEWTSQICPWGCNATSLTCNPAPTATPEIDPTVIIIIVVVVVVTIIVAVIVYKKNKKPEPPLKL